MRGTWTMWTVLLWMGCGRAGVECGAGTVEADGECVSTATGETVTVPHTETVTVTNTVTETVEVGLEPGRFEAPLVELAGVLDDEGAIGTAGALKEHMHVDEVRYRASDGKLFVCAYYFGVVDARDPADPEFLAQGFEWELPSPVDRDTGCLHLDWDDEDPDIVYVTHRGNHDFHPHLSVIDATLLQHSIGL